MGGNRFKAHNPVRLPAADAFKIEAEIVRRLKAIGVDAYPTITFPGKADYGDLDILVAEEDLLMHAGLPSEEETPAYQARKALQPVLEAVEMTRSGPLDHATSYLVPTTSGPFQVDLITHPRRVIRYAHRFYAWSDLGALVSMTARRLGLSNRATGLHVVIGDENDRGYVLVTTDYNQALTLMGFDAKKHEEGFETPEQAFEWIASSRHFDPATYDLDNLTGKSRTRASARPTQIAFREWIERTDAKARDNIVHQKDADGTWATRDAHNQRMLRHWKNLFPHVAAEEHKHLSRVRLQKEAKQARRDLMSSDSISGRTGVTGAELKVLLWQMTKHPRYEEMQKSGTAELLELVLQETKARLDVEPMTIEPRNVIKKKPKEHHR